MSHDNDIKTAEAVARIEAKLDAFVQHQKMCDDIHFKTMGRVERLEEGQSRLKGAMWIVGVIWAVLVGILGLSRK